MPKPPRVAVLGLSPLGTEIARALARQGARVLALTHNTETAQSLDAEVDIAAEADTTDADVLRRAQLADFQSVVVAHRDTERLLLAALAAKEARVDAKAGARARARRGGAGASLDDRTVWACATTPEQARLLRAQGAARVWEPRRYNAVHLAERLLVPGLHDVIPLGAGPGGGERCVAVVRCPQEWADGDFPGLDVLATLDADGCSTDGSPNWLVLSGPRAELHKLSARGDLPIGMGMGAGTGEG